MAAFVPLVAPVPCGSLHRTHSTCHPLRRSLHQQSSRRPRIPLRLSADPQPKTSPPPTASTLVWSVGHSRAEKVVDAVKEAVARASSTLERQQVRPQLAIVFVVSRGELTPDDEIRRVLPTLKNVLAMRRALDSNQFTVFGCTSANYLTDQQDTTVSVALASFPEGTVLRTFEIPDRDAFDIDWKQAQWHDLVGLPASASPSRETEKIPDELPANLQLFMLQHPDFDGMNDLLSGLDFALPGVRKFGALAGRAHALDTVYLFGGNGLITKGVVGLAFASNDVTVDVTVAQGARGVGPMLEVTEVRDGNEISKVKEVGTPGTAEAAPMVLLDLWTNTDSISLEDRKHARDYLLFGVEVQKVTDLAFSSLNDKGNSDTKGEREGPLDMVIRKVVAFNNGTGSLAVDGDVRLGSRVQFQIRDEAAAESELVLLFNKLMLEGSSKAMDGMMLNGTIMLVDSERGEHLYGKIKADADRKMYQERFPVPMVTLASEGQIGPLPAGGLLGTAGNTFTLSASALYVSFYSKISGFQAGEKTETG